MKKRLVITLLIAVLLLSGCSSAAATPASGYRAAPAAQPEQMKSDSDTAAGASNGSGMPAVEAGVPAEQPSAGNVNRLVIRNATLEIIVEDPGQTMNAINQMTSSMNGFVVSSNLYKVNTRNGIETPEANIVIRVPAAKLNDAMDAIKKLVKDGKKDILTETISGEDVTKEYTDLKSRQKNLEQAEAQLRDIMASAKKTEDVLAVYQQLTQIREQIEVIKGQIQYYEESAAMSSISVKIQAEAAVQPLQVAGWQPAGIARDALQALLNTLQFMVNAAIWLLLYFLPVVIIILLPLWVVWLIIRRVLRSRKASRPTPPPPSA